MYISEAKLHDVRILGYLDYEAGSFYMMDKAYIDYKRLYVRHIRKAYFVIRAKSNMRFRLMYSRKVDKTTTIKYDQIGKLAGVYSQKYHPEKLRKIKFYDSENQRENIFITNNMTVEATEITELYKETWKVELFFKWIKQHLKVKTFWGQNPDDIKTQIYCAIITIVWQLFAAVNLNLKGKSTKYYRF